MDDNMYPDEVLGKWDDNGTMPESRDVLAQAVVGRRIVKVDATSERTFKGQWGYEKTPGLVLTLDDGTEVGLIEQSDCCAFTDIDKFLFNADLIDHAILGVGTEDGFEKWHIYADAGDVLSMDVSWSCGNPFYYAYGFDIAVVRPDEVA